MSKVDSKPHPLWAFWAVTAAFGTYFCMYGFRKPFTAAAYADTHLWGIDFKTVLVTTQVTGYMLSKFIGIKVVSELSPKRRALGVLVLIAAAEISLVVFGAIPRPWNALALFFNGLSLGMVFGLVVGFLEGRRLTEALVAGLCASFILADGVTKSVGSWLLKSGVAEDWMPATAGLIYALPLLLVVWMLTRIAPPTKEDVVARTERGTLNAVERWTLFRRYAIGISLLVGIYLLLTLMRSFRADFAPEIWRGLGEPAKPVTFTRSEMYVALGVLVVNGCAVFARNNRFGFYVSLLTCLLGFALTIAALIGQQAGSMSAFTFMVMVGLGLYLPYVAMHTTVFERLLAMTRQHGNLGFLIYIADSVGYLGYVLIMIGRNFLSGTDNLLSFFLWLCWLAVALSIVCLFSAWRYFAAFKQQP